MGNCQDQFHNIEEYQTENDRSEVLIDRSHKRIIATHYEKNVGFLIQEEQKQHYDNEIMHKSIAMSRKTYIDKPLPKRPKNIQIQAPKLEILDLKFYYSLGLPQYTYRQKPKQMLERSWGNVGFIHEAEDRTGVIYIGQRNSKGLFQGNGILKANTVHYIGQFFQGTKHHHGRQIYTNEVYEGGFEFDFRKGQGIRYTEQYIDRGTFDKIIMKGTRTFKNGNHYTGTFMNNKMHIIYDEKGENKFQFYDASNNLIYEQDLLIEEGELIRARTVRDKTTDKQIGCFISRKVIRKEDPRYKKIIQNWNNPDANKQLEVQNKYANMKEEDIIQKRIQEWE